MPSPFREDRICAMLDSFAKTVCRNFVRNLRRDEPVRDSHLADKGSLIYIIIYAPLH